MLDPGVRDEALKVVDWPLVKEHIESWSPWHFRRAVNEAWEVVYMECIYEAFYRHDGELVKATTDLSILGAALVVVAEGLKRGFDLTPKIKRKVERNVRQIVKELAAERSGKLLSIKP